MCAASVYCLSTRPGLLAKAVLWKLYSSEARAVALKRLQPRSKVPCTAQLENLALCYWSAAALFNPSTVHCPMPFWRLVDNVFRLFLLVARWHFFVLILTPDISKRLLYFDGRGQMSKTVMLSYCCSTDLCSEVTSSVSVTCRRLRSHVRDCDLL